ncbi:MAG TPA: IS1634 family transposase [Thermoleophilaceae bacterium]|nr:IS1634 family transposase [Thermoleophilaceae bacterium]
MPEHPQPPFELRSQRLGALPVVDHFLRRIGLQPLLARHLPPGDPRVALPAGVAIGLLVRNLCVAREPLYGLREWAERHDPGLLGLNVGETDLLNDDRVGRALDQLFDCDRGSLLTELMLGVIAEFGVDCSQLHNDSTSISLHGDYTAADGRQRGGKPTPQAALGHSKDHRPDLKQFVLTLTISADGAVPLAHRLLDGNVTDDQTHIETWDGLVKLVGRPDFLYVADSKLATREQMAHIHSRGGRFISILPRSRAEDGQIRDWAQTHAFDWTEACRRPGKRKGDPEQIYWTAPAPVPTSEGHRIVWVRSSQKTARDAEARRAQIEQGMLALEAVQARLASPRSRLKTRVAAEDAARAALAAAGAQRWLSFEIAETTQESFRQEKRGRPGDKTRYRKTEKAIFTLSFKVDDAQVAYDAATDGCFPIVSNDRELSDPELLAAYRYQPNLEKRHHQLKTVLGAAPVELKSPSRIEGLACCEFIALLAQCLIERELRAAMTRDGVTELALYHEGRATRAPTAARVFDLYADATRNHLASSGETIQVFEPDLTPLQRQVLDLLAVPQNAYLSSTPDP